MISYLIILLFVIIIGLIVGFLFIKDKELSQTLQVYEKAIDDLNQSLHELKSSSYATSHDNYKDLDAKIYELGESFIKMVRTIKSMEIEQHNIENKVEVIENQLKLTLLSATSSSLNEKEIIALYQDGNAIEDIAKEKRVPIGEVELIIKLATLYNKKK